MSWSTSSCLRSKPQLVFRSLLPNLPSHIDNRQSQTHVNYLAIFGLVVSCHALLGAPVYVCVVCFLFFVFLFFLFFFFFPSPIVFASAE
ncbi:hypothetical protein FA13DRAFT_254445 [Coprinellus micaceus]|uniref:Uncharacterized protein n=1 Tax=Coprinellus micaceus TaxID=71717 RepID=A0A4Y7TE36_COPMI|nr:hypothetical protein FA13DRAFT_254445 [Coprinellus micaceus]